MNERKKELIATNNSGGSKTASGILALFLVLIVGSSLFFMFHRLIYSLQKLLYERPGENLIGSSNAVMGILAIVISLDFFIVVFLYTLTKKRYPEFYRKYYFDPNGSLKINTKAFKKFKLVLVGAFIFGICASYFFFNEYISLGDKYIAASSMSFIQNRHEYNYSEIQIYKRPPRNPDGNWIYRYVFPDGKELSNIGAFAGDTIKLIQNSQRRLGVDVSSIYIGAPKRVKEIKGHNT